MRRITPACAGRRRRLRPTWSKGKDHPRVCGEKLFVSRTAVVDVGSPPACAGRSNFRITRRRTRGDHPRVCGEKSTATSIQSSSCGSPPRVRGEADQGHQSPHRGRITPACAGRRYIRDTAGGNDADHPRVCGEKYSAKAFRCKTPGSPPRVRGEVARQRVCLHAARITPACAGRSTIFCK